MYRHNGGVRGKKRTASQGGMKTMAKGRIRGLSNGGFMGVDMRSENLQDNINKLSGIWPLHGTKFTPNGASVTTTTTVDNSYYTYPDPYQAFQETSRTYAGGGYRWFPGADAANCGMPTWPDGAYHSYTRQWTQVGSVNCSGWIFDIYVVQGYYYTVYPDPVYNEQFDQVTTVTEYDVWDWFG